MINTDALNNALAALKAVVDTAESPAELFETLMHTNDIVAQRAYELKNAVAFDSREWEWLVQVNNDARKYSDEAHRMTEWINAENM